MVISKMQGSQRNFLLTANAYIFLVPFLFLGKRPMPTALLPIIFLGLLLTETFFHCQLPTCPLASPAFPSLNCCSLPHLNFPTLAVSKKR
jgi:hypothetical protein